MAWCMHVIRCMSETTESVRIGTRKGIVWACYREPGESDADFEWRIAQMRDAYLAASARRSR